LKENVMARTNPEQIQEGDYVEYRSGPRRTSRGTVVEVYDDAVRVENEVSLHVSLILKTSVLKILGRSRRANPPLSEHMAHDDLREIASMLALRIAKAENPDAALRSFTRNLMTEVYAAANLAQAEVETPLERTLEAFLAALYPPLKRRY